MTASVGAFSKFNRLFGHSACLGLPALTIAGFIATAQPALAASPDCNTVNGASYIANMNGGATLNSGQIFTLSAGETITIFAEVPAGVKITVRFANGEVKLDNSTGTASKRIAGKITVGTSGPTTQSSILIDVMGLLTGQSVTIQFDCDGGGVTGGAVTPEQKAATADQLVGTFVEPAVGARGGGFIPFLIRLGEKKRAKERETQARKAVCDSLREQIETLKADNESFENEIDSLLESLARAQRSGLVGSGHAAGLGRANELAGDVKANKEEIALLEAKLASSECPPTSIEATADAQGDGLTPSPAESGGEQQAEERQASCDELEAEQRKLLVLIEQAQSNLDEALDAVFDADQRQTIEGAIETILEYALSAEGLADPRVKGRGYRSELSEALIKADVRTEAKSQKIAAALSILDLVNSLYGQLDRIESKLKECQKNIAPAGYFPENQQDNTRFNVVLNQSGNTSERTIDGLTGNYAIISQIGGLPVTWFVTGSVSGLDDGRAGQNRNATIWEISTGGAVQINPRTAVGIAGNYKTGEVSSAANAATLDGDYWGVSLFANHKLTSLLNLFGSVSYTHGQNDINIGGATGSFDVSVLAATTGLSGAVQLGEVVMTPSLMASIASVDRDAYVDSTGALVPGSTTETGHVSTGASFARTFEGSGAIETFTPSIGLFASYNFRSFEQRILASGIRAEQVGAGATLNGGVAFQFENGASAGINGSYGLFEQGVDSWSLNARLTVPLN